MKNYLERVYINSMWGMTGKGGIQDKFLVDGRLQTASKTEPITTPLTESGEYWEAPSLNEEESLEILDSSERAWDNGNGIWAQKSLDERCNILSAFVADMKTIRDPVVAWLIYEIGKNDWDARKEFDRTIEYIEKTIDAARTLQPIHKDRPGDLHTIQDRMPLGITLCMSPFNYPLNETFTTFIPALIMGNVAILKPARYGVLFWQHFLPLFQKHFPAGVVNTVYGDGATVITPLMKSGKIDVLAFIWSWPVAKIIADQHPYPHRLRQILWLGAKNPWIITSTADIDNAVKQSLLGALSYNGQRCTALKILFVQNAIAELFTQKFVAAVEDLKIGQPGEWYTTVKKQTIIYDPTVTVSITPMPEKWKITAMNAYIQDAVDKWATILNKDGGTSHHQLMVPAVLGNVSANMRVMHEEQFGPIVPIVTYTIPQEPIDRVMNSAYGQQLSIFSQDPEEINALYSKLNTQVWRININDQCQRWPDEVAFSATKGSAVGTLSIKDALLKFSKDRVLAEKWSIYMK